MPENTPGGGSVAEVVAGLFEKELRAPVSLEETIEHLPNIESMKLMRVIGRIEDEFGISLDTEEMFTAQTVGDIARIVGDIRDGTLAATVSTVDPSAR
ncbi:acyl carrier protein [Mycobacterium sp. LTG2003]